MVDINTALAAAATERKNRGAGQKDRKKNRSGSDLGIESFDPVKHVAKERADTVSMWLVLAFGATTALLMRYVAMPSSQDSPDLLWLLPMMCIFLLPSIHRAVLPEKFVEHYTKGTWFKASFLHIFTWLALTFILTNAPFADIVAPQVDSGWGMISENDEGFDFEKSRSNQITILENYTGAHYLVLSFSDNVLSSGATYTITATWSDENLVNSWTNISAVDSNALDDVRTHKSIDYPVAVAIPESLDVGTYVVDIKVVEEGDPWTNSRTVSMKLVVEEIPELTE